MVFMSEILSIKEEKIEEEGEWEKER